MNFLSINLRGVRDSRKSDWIRGLKSCHSVHFLCVQETKISDPQRYAFNQLWGRSVFRMASVDSQGRSGGLASIWDPTVFSDSEHISHRYFLCVCGFLIPSGIRLNVVNVYAPNDAALRKILWSELLSLRNSRQGLWVFLGDFNDVRYPEERLNSEFVTTNAEAFNTFILSAGLQEYDMGGAKFTYVSDNGEKLSKLDRVLVCIGFIENWPGAALTALERCFSDHRPLLLSAIPADFGHVPFRFYNSWLDWNGFVPFVLGKCEQFYFNGPADLGLATKLRWLKNRIKEWVAAEKRNIEGSYSTWKARVAELELLAEERILQQSELDQRLEYKQLMLEVERQKQADSRQKSRARWAIEGDENTSFFHSIVNANLSANRINGMMDGDEWITNPAIIKQKFHDFFAHLLAEPMESRPVINCPNISVLAPEDGDYLIRPFSLLEIKDAVWECDGDKAPGPDGFNFKFLKRCWNGLQGNFVKLFEEFYANPHISRSCSSSFIALIPKIKDPLMPSDFRPISLIGCINKVISKVLVNRLKKVIGRLISEEQTAFLKGRNITDGPLMLNEICAWLKKSRKTAMIFKVDIHKAYDSLCWGFLNAIMAQMGFPSRWREWIMATLKSARASVLINGSPTMEFECSRGLRQGDPLSPFLFIIAMEAISGIMKRALVDGIFHGVKCNNTGMTLSHFLYADDVVFLGEWSETNAANLRRILRCFYLSSGLQVNFTKSRVYGVGVPEEELEALANTLRCRQGSFPFKYLGLYVGANMNLVKHWRPVIDIFKNRLSIWKAKKLSYGGRITLLKSVLSSLPTYFFSLYKAPIQVLDQLERMRRIFFWGGTEEVSKMSWMAWESVVAPTKYGGLGFGSLRDANLSMLAKWWWRFKTEPGNMWRKVVWAIHSNSRDWNTIPVKLSCAGPWKQIHSIAPILRNKGVDIGRNLIGVVHEGTDIAFWVDTWCGTEPFFTKFPALFQVEKEKWCSVADRLQSGVNGVVWRWEWRRHLLDGEETSQFQQLTSMLVGVSAGVGRDSWQWKLDSSLLFTVASVKHILQCHNRSAQNYVVEWNNWIPKKVGIVAWRAEKERLPTKDALAKRGITVQSSECIICRNYPETSEHLLVSCEYAQIVWQIIFQWCKSHPIITFSLKDILESHKQFGGSRKKKKTFHAVCQITIWSLWNMRNELMFSGKSTSVTNLVEEIKSKSFLWIKNRSKNSELTWDQWRVFDVF
ncbi:putative RNA-directed DNA polymerase [Helianthus annuus]|nr:putative RNA-directed DNA polymerase [Helianthus annuus]KAJ0455820.1 putative RNA-directed DNA polymerase [Helianthus annuus]